MYNVQIDGYECIQIWKKLQAKGETPSCAKVAQELPISPMTGKPFTRQAVRMAMMGVDGGKELLAIAADEHWKGKHPGSVRHLCMKNEMSTYAQVPGIESYRSLEDAVGNVLYGMVPAQALFQCSEWHVMIEGKLQQFVIKRKGTRHARKTG